MKWHFFSPMEGTQSQVYWLNCFVALLFDQKQFILFIGILSCSIPLNCLFWYLALFCHLNDLSKILSLCSPYKHSYLVRLHKFVFMLFSENVTPIYCATITTKDIYIHLNFFFYKKPLTVFQRKQHKCHVFTWHLCCLQTSRNKKVH